MSNSQIVAAILTALVGVTAFLLKFMFTKIAQWLEEKLSFLTSRIDSLGEKVDSLATKFAASSVREERNEQEINTLRMRQHEMANEQAKIQAIIEKCKNCTKQ
jgi:cell shape-determining protein MreC